MRYIVQWRYHSSLCDRHGLGRLGAGECVDIDPAIAAAINTDSPGVLLAVAGNVVDDEPFERIPADRMLRKPGRKRAV